MPRTVELQDVALFILDENGELTTNESKRRLVTRMIEHFNASTDVVDAVLTLYIEKLESRQSVALPPHKDFKACMEIEVLASEDVRLRLLDQCTRFDQMLYARRIGASVLHQLQPQRLLAIAREYVQSGTRYGEFDALLTSCALETGLETVMTEMQMTLSTSEKTTAHIA